MASRSRKVISSGNDLAEALRLPVAEGRYHFEADFYKQPTEFPCAFFDCRGYLIVDSGEKLRKLAHVSAGLVNFPRRVSKIQGYRYCEDWRDWPRKVKSVRANRKLRTLLQTMSDDGKRKILKELGLRPLDPL